MKTVRVGSARPIHASALACITDIDTDAACALGPPFAHHAHRTVTARGIPVG
jgi:hypothetical protein